MAFTHLHVHTEYSLLDGASRIKDVVARTKELGMEALAITDHGVMFGVIDFYRECNKQGIKPIIGCEVYTAARKMTDKTPEFDKHQGHLILLAKNNDGYKNLIKIVSKGFTEGYYYKPRIDKDVLRDHSEGIIALSACLAGKVQNCLLHKDYAGAKAEASELLEIFGEGNFYLEIQDQGLEDEMAIKDDMFRLSQELNVPLVATNDVHYVRQEDAKAHDVLLAIQTATTLDDENRMRFPNDQFYLKSEDEMRKVFAYAPEAIDRTQEIVDKCSVTFTFGEYHIPIFESPDGMTNEEHLRKLCNEGLIERYGDANAIGEEKFKELKERMEYELNVIESMGYVGYFLIVWDFINYAKSNGIMVGPGRGSAAGSIVAYCLHITDIDPIRYSLIFERFLNPERVSMPDIDVDFCYERRPEVIQYVIDKYGQDKVSQIVTFGTMKAKQAVRDVGRALGVSYADTDAIAKAIPNDLKMTISKALEMNPELKARYDQEEQVRQVIDMAQALEGMPRHASTHAAGVVISKESIDEYVPLYVGDRGAATQFPMTTIEELGLLKMDFLGLRNLTVIRDALQLIEKNYGEKIDFSKMSYDDPAVYKMISEGNTQGVFQLESSGMTQFMKNLKPTCFEDIVAGISLYRPGPMDSIPKYIENKKNPDKIKYVDPKLAPILDVTYGCLVYQEQVMQIVRELGGYSYGRSDLVRRAMSKKKHDVMMEEKEYFINGKVDDQGKEEIRGCIKNGVSREAAEAIFEDMVTFASYAFNKSHAAAYAVVAYETAYLKVHYPVAFMAALMTSVMGDSNQISKYIRNCGEMGIEILPPDINKSFRTFDVEDGKIRFGLQGIKSVGENAIENIVKSREEKGLPKDIFQFISNIDPSIVNKKAVECLIKAGALDGLNPNRAAHLQVYETLLESAQTSAKKNIAGQMSLFDIAGSSETAHSGIGELGNKLPDVVNFDNKILLMLEKEMLGIYITDHPLNEYSQLIKEKTNVNSDELRHAADEDYVGGTIEDGMKGTIAGMVNSVKTLITKSNKMMAFVEIEDLYGTVEIIVFPNVYEKYHGLLSEDNVVAVTGTVNFKEDESPKILADTIVDIHQLESMAKAEPQASRPQTSRAQALPMEEEPPLKLRIPKELQQEVTLSRLQLMVKMNPGKKPVLIYLANGKILKSGPADGVELREEILAQFIEILGEGNVKS